METTTKKQTLYERGLKAASRYLESRGYEVIEENWSCDAGSIELICENEDSLCFVEVKTRKTGGDLGFPEENTSAQNRKKLELIAANYLMGYDKTGLKVRFDKIALLVVSEDRAFLRHHIDCFNA